MYVILASCQARSAASEAEAHTVSDGSEVCHRQLCPRLPRRTESDIRSLWASPTSRASWATRAGRNAFVSGSESRQIVTRVCSEVRLTLIGCLSPFGRLDPRSRGPCDHIEEAPSTLTPGGWPSGRRRRS